MNTCSACRHTYHDDKRVERCRLSALETERESRAMSASGCKTFALAAVAVPKIVQQRWNEEAGRSSYTGWRSLAQLCASIAIQAERARPHSPLADLMAAKAKEAHGHMLALQPKEEFHAC